MSGHSKWATIKHQKGAKDAQKGKIFTKLANAITLAARELGADPESNFKLRLSIDKARSSNMPKENIERAIERAKPGKDTQLEEVTYEGFGPAGIAILVKALTDNKNRMISDIRSVFNNFGGKLATSGSVRHQFTQYGVLHLSGGNLDELELAAIDLGAQDTERDNDILIIYSQPEHLHKLKTGLETRGAKVEDTNFSFEAQNPIYIKEEDQAKKILEFMQALEDVEGVVGTWANFDLDNEILTGDV